VVKVKGSVLSDELSMLTDIAGWLELDSQRFRDMMTKILPASMHQVKDAQVILGVTSDMTEEKARTHLNKEYLKWNARVTNSDPEIQAQAELMLKLIAQARTQKIDNLQP
jgi:hypothetical protein